MRVGCEALSSLSDSMLCPNVCVWWQQFLLGLVQVPSMPRSLMQFLWHVVAQNAGITRTGIIQRRLHISDCWAGWWIVMRKKKESASHHVEREAVKCIPNRSAPFCLGGLFLIARALKGEKRVNCKSNWFCKFYSSFWDLRPVLSSSQSVWEWANNNLEKVM